MERKLETLLRERGAECLVICGLATGYWVVETSLDAMRLRFPTTVLPQGVRAVNLEPGDGDRPIERMLGAGVEVV